MRGCFEAASFSNNPLIKTILMAFSAEQLLDKVNTYLATMPYMREPKGLYAPIEYVLSLGGKRIRPVLMLLSYQLYKENVDDILSQAAGIETYHNYTIVA